MTDQTTSDTEPTDLATALIELRHAREEVARLRPFVDMVDQAQRDAEAAELANPAPLLALAAREKTIRDHTLTLHLMGEQLGDIESWFWSHLADVREAARKELGGLLPNDVTRIAPPEPLSAPGSVPQASGGELAGRNGDRSAKVALGDPELTADEARELVDELGLELYRAQGALAFVEECCAIADQERRTITTADVREWLKGARCGRQMIAEQSTQTAPNDEEGVTEQPLRR